MTIARILFGMTRYERKFVKNIKTQLDKGISVSERDLATYNLIKGGMEFPTNPIKRIKNFFNTYEKVVNENKTIMSLLA